MTVVGHPSCFYYDIEQNMIKVNPSDTKRARAFELWLNAPMPMATIVKRYDVGRAVKYSRKSGMRFNALLCWAILKAASDIEEFYMVPEADHLCKYDKLALNMVVATQNGNINFCDVPFSEDIQQFYADYTRLTRQVAESDVAAFIGDEYAVIGTSALTMCEFEVGVNQYAGTMNNPFLVWGRYRKGLFKTTLPISMQFHHLQMDGATVAAFMNHLQDVINSLR